jgi:hypothetical protein
MVQLAQGPQEGFLDHFLTQVLFAADAVETKTVQGQQGLVGQRLHRGRVPSKGPSMPIGIEIRLQAQASFLPSWSGKHGCGAQ